METESKLKFEIIEEKIDNVSIDIKEIKGDIQDWIVEQKGIKTELFGMTGENGIKGTQKNHEERIIELEKDHTTPKDKATSRALNLSYTAIALCLIIAILDFLR